MAQSAITLPRAISNRFLGFLPPKIFCALQYAYRLRTWPDFTNPHGFNEKIQWLKLHYRDPLLAKCVDKFLVRQVVVDMGLEELLIPSLGVFTSAAEIPFDDFPEKFVLKATHGSGWTIVCKNKASFDQNAAIEEMSGWLKRNFYREGREWPYKELQPRIVAEAYLEGENGEPPPDLKIFCFHGEPKIIQVDSDRFVEHRRNMLDTEWNTLPFEFEYPASKHSLEKPGNLSKILETARRLAKPFPLALR